jgi:hypothetical protein
MTHPYKDYFICRDNYFEKPNEIIELSKTLNYARSTYYPGERTGNLLGFEDPAVKNFADWFANRLSYDIFPGISLYELYLCFHVNVPCSDPQYNKGWIHNDYGNLAGLVYLTPGEDDLNTGTSMFNSDSESLTDVNELKTDAAALKEFYLYDKITPEFATGFENNRQMFEHRETIRIGNKFNRIIAYDSKMWHRPNSFTTTSETPRLSLLFFVSQFNYD